MSQVWSDKAFAETSQTIKISQNSTGYMPWPQPHFQGAERVWGAGKALAEYLSTWQPAGLQARGCCDHTSRDSDANAVNKLNSLRVQRDKRGRSLSSVANECLSILSDLIFHQIIATSSACIIVLASLPSSTLRALGLRFLFPASPTFAGCRAWGRLWIARQPWLRCRGNMIKS